MNAPGGDLATRLSAAGAFGRGAIVLSVLVHAGLAAAFVGWGDAPPTPVSALPVAFVAVPATDIVTEAAPPTPPAAAPHFSAGMPLPPVTGAVAEAEPVAQRQADAAPDAAATGEPLPATLPEPPETVLPLPEPPPTDIRATTGPATMTGVASQSIGAAPPEKPDPLATIPTQTDVVASTARAAEAPAATAAPASSDETAITRDYGMTASPPPDEPIANAPALPPAERTPASNTQFAALPSGAAASDSGPAAEAEFEPARFDLATLSNPRPDYPWLSRQRGEEGRVVLRVEVTSDGRVASIDIAESSGHRRLDEAALETVLQWTFEPARIGGDPVATTVNVPVTFQLRN